MPTLIGHTHDDAVYGHYTCRTSHNEVVDYDDHAEHLPVLPTGMTSPTPTSCSEGIPVTEFAELRKTTPVWWNDQSESIFDDGGYWVISRHEDIKAISRNGDLWSTNRKGAVMRLPDGTTPSSSS